MTRPQLTDEVQQALADLRASAPPPPVPDGQVRYYVAVGTSVHSGTATAASIIAVLRGLADNLEKETP